MHADLPRALSANDFADPGTGTIGADPAISISIADVAVEDLPRFSTGIDALDRVLGGGLVPGSSITLAGAPGCGKSTLLSQAIATLRTPAGDLCRAPLWASAEETVGQIAARSRRCGTNDPRVRVAHHADVDAILALARRDRPDVLVVDSAHTIATRDISSRHGSVSQVTECASRLNAFAKETDTPVVIICHVNKDLDVAGPQTLCHLVDGLFEIRADGDVRILSSTGKNRNGSTSEVGYFRMGNDGLREMSPEDIDAYLGEMDDGDPPDRALPIAQELWWRYHELGGRADDELRERAMGIGISFSPRGEH